jgi:hypothetical protein
VARRAGPLPADRAAARDQLEYAMGTPDGRRQLTRMGDGRGLAFYAYYYLQLATPECHRRWYRACARATRLLLLAPRSHGKSVSTGRVYAGREIVCNRNIRILIISLTKGAAAKTARLIRRDLERNPRIREDWTSEEAGGPFRDKGLSWTDSFFYVRRSRDARDPTIEAVGVGGAITGGRFDLIIVDDPSDDKSARTERQRRKLVEWLYGTVIELLDDDGRVLVIGTRKHNADVYRTLMDDPTFEVVKDEAILEWPEMDKVQWVEQVDPVTGRRRLVDVIVPEGQGRVLWPQKWSIKKLLLKFRSMGSTLFMRENQNECVDDGTSPFKEKWLKGARDFTRGLLEWGVHPETGETHPKCAGLIVWQSVDFSLVDDPDKAAEKGSDWTIICTWGLDWESGRRYLLRIVRRQGLTDLEVMALVRAEAALFPQRIAVVVENNSFGKLHEMGLKRTTALPIYGHYTDRKKHDLYEGVPSMAALYEGGKYVLPYARPDDLGEGESDPRGVIDVFIAEHHGLGRERHDDTVMCAWIGDTWIRRYEAAEERRRKQGGVRITTG